MTAQSLLLGNVITDLCKDFGVSGDKLVLQFLTFIIVLVALRLFAFKPIQEILDQRKQRIAEGEEKIKRIEKELAECDERTKTTLEEANTKAKRLINEAKESANNLSEEKQQEAISKAQGIIEKAKATCDAYRVETETSIKQELGRLVASTTAAVTGKVLTDDDNKRINEESLKNIQS